MKTVPLDSQDIRLITYIPGGGGNFLYKVITEFFANTAKIESSDFSFSDTGNAHNAEFYIKVFHLHKFLEKNPGKTIDDYEYKAEVIRDVDLNNKQIVIRCDLGGWDASPAKVLNRFPNAKMVRVYAGEFISNLIATLNLFEKLGTFEYKNAIFDKEYLDYIKTLDGDFDENVIKHLNITFKHDLDGYNGPRVPFEHKRVYNIEFGSFFSYETFYHEMVKLADFFRTTINDKVGLKLFYDNYHSLQNNYRYATISKDSNVSDNDLIGQALKRFYEEEK